MNITGHFVIHNVIKQSVSPSSNFSETQSFLSLFVDETGLKLTERLTMSSEVQCYEES